MFLLWSYVKALLLYRRVIIRTRTGHTCKTLRPADITAAAYRDEMKGTLARAHMILKFGSGTNWLVINTNDIESIEVY